MYAVISGPPFCLVTVELSQAVRTTRLLPALWEGTLIVRLNSAGVSVSVLCGELFPQNFLDKSGKVCN